MSVENFENKYWRKHDQEIVFRHKAALALIKKEPVLDFGCGDGLFLELMKKKGIEGVGFDISEVAVQKAREKGLDVRKFDFADKRLPLEDNSFGTVVLLDVLEHLYEPKKVLVEAHRVTKGDLIISVPNFNSLPARIQMLLGRIPENNKHRQGHIYWISYSIIKDLLKENGFSIEVMKVNSFFVWLPGIRNLMQFLAKIKPSLFALTFIIKAKKT